jgi:hypothetical protein
MDSAGIALLAYHNINVTERVMLCRGINILCRPARLTCLIAMLVGVLSLCAVAQDDSSAEPSSSTPVVTKSAPRTRSEPSPPLLPRKMMVSLKVVQQFFPTVTRELNNGANPSPFGQPKATRVVIYSTGNGAKKVILSVDDYANPSEAWLAYQQAVKKTQLPEFTLIAVSNMGQQVVAGTVPEGGETHTEVTTLDGPLIVGGALAGFEATTDEIGRLVELTREELSEAKAHASTRRRF